jgi:uncharacterized membrane protein
MDFSWLEPYHPWFLLVHVSAAIVALGGNVGYVFWLSRAERDRAHLGYTVAGIRRLDERVTGPAYALLLVSGIVMILAEGWSITEPWLLSGIVLYFASGLVSFFGLTPALRAQLSAAEQGTAGPAYEAAARRSRQMAWLVVAIVTVVVWLMVVKPTI